MPKQLHAALAEISALVPERLRGSSAGEERPDVGRSSPTRDSERPTPGRTPLTDASDRIARGALFVLFALFAAPLFVRVGGPSLIGLPDTASASSGGVNIPVGAVFAVLVASWLIVRRARHTEYEGTPLDRAIVLFAAVAFGVLLLGLFTRPGPYNVLYFGQTILPLAAYYLVSRLVRTEGVARRAVAFAIGGALVSGGLMLMQALVSRGPVRMLSSQLDNHVGPLNIYQANDYVPFVFAIVFLVALHERTVTDRLGPITMLLLCGLGVVVLGSYARGPVFLLILGMAALAVQTWRAHPHQTLRALFVTGAAFGIAVALGFPSTERVVALVRPIVNPAAKVAPPSLATGEPSGRPNEPSAPTASAVPPSVADFDDSSTVVDQPSNDTRTIAIRIATDYLVRNPAYGGGFAPIPWEDLSPILAGYPPTKLFTAHNQYLDLGLRGGVPLIVAYIVAMAAAIYTALRIARSNPTVAIGAIAGAVLTALTAGLLVGNLYQNNFTQPYPAFLLWGLIGLLAGLDVRRHERLVLARRE